MEWVTCENTYEESWRRLMEYANVELAIDAIDAIEREKGTPKSSRDKNDYKNRAEEARVSLLQAKEYFEAAKSSSLFTQPNHLYYGMVALSTACMLIRGGREKTLEYLRKDSVNKHHGLSFSFTSSKNKSKEDIKLLDNSFIEIYPNGHFKNWYETLIKTQPIFSLREIKRINSKTSGLTRCGDYDIPSFEELNELKKNITFIIKRFPDLSSDLGRYGISASCARGNHKINSDLNTGYTQHNFMFHNATSNETLLEIIDRFECEEGINFCINIEENQKAGSVKTHPTKELGFSFPDSRETLDNNTIFYSENVNTPEIADLYLVSYSLSMLSRYHPDIWVSFLESHCKGAKLVERVVRILMLKSPSLMLNQIANEHITISNHKPYWYGKT